MPQQAWNAKRERQYEHIKEGLEERGRSEDVAEEIAARTVNKAREGRRIPRSQPQLARRYLLRTSRRAPVASRSGRTNVQPALQRGEGARPEGPSKMSKAQLERALSR